jgi:hypothetical protein
MEDLDLLSYEPININSEFTGKLEEKDFKKNLKKQSSDWIYRFKKIIYRNNNLGFRSKPFDQVNWEESIVVLGCSNVYGTGLAEEDTVSNKLEEILKIPTINLGVPASAVDLSCWNSLILHEKNYRPRAVVQIWSDLARYTDKFGNILRPFGAGSNSYISELDWTERSKFYIMSDRALWRGKAAYHEGSFFPDTANTLNIDSFRCDDCARDLAHPGIESARIAAERIAESLKKQGL